MTEHFTDTQILYMFIAHNYSSPVDPVISQNYFFLLNTVLSVSIIPSLFATATKIIAKITPYLAIVILYSASTAPITIIRAIVTSTYKFKINNRYTSKIFFAQVFIQ